MLCHENGCDCEQVFCEFLCFASGLWLAALTVNQEFDASLFKDELQQLCCKSCKSVFVHNHNLCDIACDTLVQNGVKPFAVEVDT